MAKSSPSSSPRLKLNLKQITVVVVAMKRIGAIPSIHPGSILLMVRIASFLSLCLDSFPRFCLVSIIWLWICHVLQAIKVGTTTQTDTWAAKDNHIWITGTLTTRQEVGSSFVSYYYFYSHSLTHESGKPTIFGDVGHDSCLCVCCLGWFHFLVVVPVNFFRYFLGNNWWPGRLSCFLCFSLMLLFSFSNGVFGYLAILYLLLLLVHHLPSFHLSRLTECYRMMMDDIRSIFSHRSETR